MAKLRGVRGAAGWCAASALLYLLVRRGGTVLTQEVCLHTDLSGHLDGFAAVLAAFQ